MTSLTEIDPVWWLGSIQWRMIAHKWLHLINGLIHWWTQNLIIIGKGKVGLIRESRSWGHASERFILSWHPSWLPLSPTMIGTVLPHHVFHTMMPSLTSSQEPWLIFSWNLSSCEPNLYPLYLFIWEVFPQQQKWCQDCDFASRCLSELWKPLCLPSTLGYCRSNCGSVESGLSLL